MICEQRLIIGMIALFVYGICVGYAIWGYKYGKKRNGKGKRKGKSGHKKD